MSVIHSFADSLALSERHANDPFWKEVYQKAFPTMEHTYLIREDGWAQRGGVDRVVVLKSGKQYFIEQKVREPVYPDILLEYWSSIEHQRLGWIEKDSLTDYLAYAFLPTRKCYLIDFAALRRVWQKRRQVWIDRGNRHSRGFHTVRARNRGYTTVSVAVPTEGLLQAVMEYSCISWSEEAIS